MAGCVCVCVWGAGGVWPGLRPTPSSASRTHPPTLAQVYVDPHTQTLCSLKGHGLLASMRPFSAGIGTESIQGPAEARTNYIAVG